MRMISAAIVILVGTAIADPVTYEVDAVTGRSGGTLTGAVTWESSSVTVNTDLTLGNASAWSFTLATVAGVVSTWSKSDAHTTITDRARFSGTFGSTDLTPLDGHGWTVTDIGALGDGHVALWDDGPGPSVLNISWLHRTTGVSNDARKDSDGFAPSPSWHLVLANNTPPIPEPGTYALFGLSLVGYALYRGRRKAS